MKMRRGFTLVEMLTVIVIILILAGATMKLMALVTRKTAIARAAGDIERIKSALASYYALNGCYPPAPRLDRQFPHPRGINGPTAPPKNGAGYYDGMMTYLFSVDGKLTGQPWAKFLDGWEWSGTWKEQTGNNPISGNLIWSNCYHYINDPWGQFYVYSSGPPYQTYILLSVGPDGVMGTPEKNADNIGDKWLE